MADIRKQRKLGKGRHKSALKRHRQEKRRSIRNQPILSGLSTYLKRARTAIAAKDKDKAQGILKTAIPFIARAASKGVIHKRSAARYTSRLMQAYNRI